MSNIGTEGYYRIPYVRGIESAFEKVSDESSSSNNLSLVRVGLHCSWHYSNSTLLAVLTDSTLVGLYVVIRVHLRKSQMRVRARRPSLRPPPIHK
jgi:hypothetical protein